MPYSNELWEFQFRRCHARCETFATSWDNALALRTMRVGQPQPYPDWCRQGYYNDLKHGLLYMAHLAEDIPCGCLFRLYNTHTKEEIVSAIFA